MSGRTSSALAWAPGPGRFPARSSGKFGICVTRLPEAAHGLSLGLTFVTNNAKHFGA